MGIWTDHPNSTENSQSYWEHLCFALLNSSILFIASLAGMVHAIFPFLFPFFASTRVIRAFRGIVGSKRHEPELLRELPKAWRFGTRL